MSSSVPSTFLVLICSRSSQALAYHIRYHLWWKCTSEVDAKVGLLSSPTQPGYIDTLAAQLDKLQQTPGNNTILRQHIQNVKSAIADLRDWVQKLRNYDVPLVQAANIGYPALANNALQVKQIASDAYTGRTIPPDNGPRPTLGSAGAYQAYVECQYLATLDIKKA